LPLPLLLLAQLAAPADGARPEQKTVAPACSGKAEDEVLVCGSRQARSPYRLPELPTEYETKRDISQVRLTPGVNARVTLESAELPGGAKSDRIMVRFKAGF
jgi:hypothetical protein